MTEETKTFKDSRRRKSPKFTITLPPDVAKKVMDEGGKPSRVIAKRLRQAYASDNTES